VRPSQDPLIDAVGRAVAARAPVDDRERHSQERFLAELDRLEHPFDEHADVVHVTASAIIVGARGVVLHLHKRLGLWLQPGGHIDPGEAPWDAAWREASEETGLELQHADPGPELVHVDVHRGAHDHTHLDLRYLMRGADRDPSPGPDESQDVAWFDWRRAIEIADPGLVGALRALNPLPSPPPART
jgi:8-oxo-dGTP pyrophosphatase MutT (NUDIX family)